MIPFLVRLAVLGSALVVAANVVITWMRALSPPRKKEALPSNLPPSPARDISSAPSTSATLEDSRRSSSRLATEPSM